MTCFPYGGPPSEYGQRNADDMGSTSTFPHPRIGGRSVSETIKIKIMLLVGSNGKASAAPEGDLDWGDLADNIMDWDGNRSTDPDATARYFVEVEVPKPSILSADSVVSPAHPTLPKDAA